MAEWAALAPRGKNRPIDQYNRLRHAACLVKECALRRLYMELGQARKEEHRRCQHKEKAIPIPQRKYVRPVPPGCEPR